jgi:hypothetical protein
VRHPLAAGVGGRRVGFDRTHGHHSAALLPTSIADAMSDLVLERRRDTHKVTNCASKIFGFFGQKSCNYSTY